MKISLKSHCRFAEPTNQPTGRVSSYRDDLPPLLSRPKPASIKTPADSLVPLLRLASRPTSPRIHRSPRRRSSGGVIDRSTDLRSAGPIALHHAGSRAAAVHTGGPPHTARRDHPVQDGQTGAGARQEAGSPIGTRDAVGGCRRKRRSRAARGKRARAADKRSENEGEAARTGDEEPEASSYEASSAVSSPCRCPCLPLVITGYNSNGTEIYDSNINPDVLDAYFEEKEKYCAKLGMLLITLSSPRLISSAIITLGIALVN